jgi:hypothetical protein
MSLRSFWLGDWKASTKFLLPYTIFGTIVFVVVYTLGWHNSLGTVEGYGWSNSKLLDFWFGVLNLKVPKEFYPWFFAAYYFLFSVPIQEYLFRVLPLKFIKNPLVYIWIINIGFTFLHIYYMKPISLILVFGMGVLVSIDYLKNRSFLNICLFHFLLAAIAFTLNLA